MLGGFDPSKLGEMMRQVQEQAEQMQEQIKQTEITAKAGGGMVQIKANGIGEVIDVTIDDSLLEDKESLQILLISAMNDLHQSVEANKKNQAMGLLGGLNPFGS